jgi:hypothetical protein
MTLAVTAWECAPQKVFCQVSELAYALTELVLKSVGLEFEE